MPKTLERINSLEQIKSLETRDLKSKYVRWNDDGSEENEYWTTEAPLLAIDQQGRKIIIDQWFINPGNELIYSNKNEYFNLEMYLGITSPKSYISDLYIL